MTILRSTEVYIVEYHAGGGGTSRKLLCDYAPHFYRLETADGTEVCLVRTGPALAQVRTKGENDE